MPARSAGVDLDRTLIANVFRSSYSVLLVALQLGRHDTSWGCKLSDAGYVLHWEGRGAQTKECTLTKKKNIQPPGIGPGSSAWQADILPLDHGCVAVGKIRCSAGEGTFGDTGRFLSYIYLSRPPPLSSDPVHVNMFLASTGLLVPSTPVRAIQRPKAAMSLLHTQTLPTCSAAHGRTSKPCRAQHTPCRSIADRTALAHAAAQSQPHPMVGVLRHTATAAVAQAAFVPGAAHAQAIESVGGIRAVPGYYSSMPRSLLCLSQTIAGPPFCLAPTRPPSPAWPIEPAESWTVATRGRAAGRRRERVLGRWRGSGHRRSVCSPCCNGSSE